MIISAACDAVTLISLLPLFLLCGVAADRKCHRYMTQMVNVVTKASSGNSLRGCMLSAA